MSLEKLLGKATAVATDAGLWMIGTLALAYYGVKETSLLHNIGEFWKKEPFTPAQGVLLLLPVGCIIVKNIIDYNRIENVIARNGWNTDIFHKGDGMKAELYARANNMMGQYHETKREYEREIAGDDWF